MKKQSAKQPRTEEEPEVSHLDAAITEITATTAQALKRWKKPIIGVVVLLFAAAVVFTIVSAFTESRELGLSERLFELFESPAARKDDYVLDATEVSRLLADVRGKRSEPYVLKAVAEFYLDQAERIAKKAEKKAEADATPSTPPGAPTSTAGGQLDSGSKARVEAGLGEALKIAEEAARRLPEDADIQHWATKLKAKVEGDRKTDWLPPRWKYSPPLPRSVEGTHGGATVGAAPPASPPENGPAAVPAAPVHPEPAAQPKPPVSVQPPQPESAPASPVPVPPAPSKPPSAQPPAAPAASPQPAPPSSPEGAK